MSNLPQVFLHQRKSCHSQIQLSQNYASRTEQNYANNINCGDMRCPNPFLLFYLTLIYFIEYKSYDLL